MLAKLLPYLGLLIGAVIFFGSFWLMLVDTRSILTYTITAGVGVAIFALSATKA